MFKRRLFDLMYSFDRGTLKERERDCKIKKISRYWKIYDTSDEVLKQCWLGNSISLFRINQSSLSYSCYELEPHRKQSFICGVGAQVLSPFAIIAWGDRSSDSNPYFCANFPRMRPNSFFVLLNSLFLKPLNRCWMLDYSSCLPFKRALIKNRTMDR